MQKTALITGITGQVGSHLADLLLSKDYHVHGLIRRSSTFPTERIEHIYQDPHIENARLRLHYGDLTDGGNLRRLISEIRPNEIYHLGAQSHVRVSFDCPQYTSDVVALGTLRLLEALRDVDRDREIRLYNASSSEMYGDTPPVQNEESKFDPCSPYACAKLYAHHIVKNYRESYGMHLSSGIVFNTEGPRRGETFVTRKITRGAARIKVGLQDKLYLGNLDAKRDWSYAGDSVRGMWLMLQQDKPDDYVIATGESYSIRDWLDICFGQVGLKWEDHVEFDPRYVRPVEVNHLQGDASKAKDVLGWEPTVDIHHLAAMMLENDLDIANREQYALTYPG